MFVCFRYSVLFIDVWRKYEGQKTRWQTNPILVQYITYNTLSLLSQYLLQDVSQDLSQKGRMLWLHDRLYVYTGNTDLVCE